MLKKDYKVEVTPEESREILKLAFKCGYEWVYLGKGIELISKPFLYLDHSCGDICDSSEEDRHEFEEDSNKLITPKKIIKKLKKHIAKENKQNVDTCEQVNTICIEVPQPADPEMSAWDFIKTLPEYTIIRIGKDDCYYNFQGEWFDIITESHLTEARLTEEFIENEDVKASEVTIISLPITLGD